MYVESHAYIFVLFEFVHPSLLPRCDEIQVFFLFILLLLFLFAAAVSTQCQKTYPPKMKKKKPKWENFAVSTDPHSD